MNKYYGYDNLDLWKTETWAEKVAPLSHLIEYIQETNEVKESDYVPTFEYEGDLHDHPLYRPKTHGFDDPGVIEELNKKGLTYLATGQGGKAGKECCWFCVCPTEAIENWNKLPVFLAFECEDEDDARWTMRALKRYTKHIDEIAEKRDFLLVVLVNQFPVYDKIYFNIMQEFSVLFPCDISRMYLDVSRVVEKGKLKDVPGFVYEDEKGNTADPDAAVELFGEMKIPVLNITGRWGNGDSLSRALVVTHRMNDGRFDREWMIHSETGKKMANDMLYEYHHDSVESPAFQKEMEEKGFVYEVCRTPQGDRYIWAIPRQAVEEQTVLPVVLFVQEVYEGNEHLAVTAHSYGGQYVENAAQGEFALCIFALEDIESNDRIIDCIKKDAERYPLDLSRVYLTGHSHDGYFSFAMADRNPDFVAAIAVLGMGLVSGGMNAGKEYERDYNIRTRDMPAICVTGLCESGFPKTEEEKQKEWLPSWKQVFRNYHITKSDEEILAAFDSEDHAQRVTCLAGDRFQTLWMDGFEHYIVDFKNDAGKYHLRIVRDQNMPHTITPFMCNIAWDFLRRFRRNPETHEIEELF